MWTERPELVHGSVPPEDSTSMHLGPISPPAISFSKAVRNHRRIDPLSSRACPSLHGRNHRQRRHRPLSASLLSSRVECRWWVYVVVGSFYSFLSLVLGRERERGGLILLLFSTLEWEDAVAARVLGLEGRMPVRERRRGFQGRAGGGLGGDWLGRSCPSYVPSILCTICYPSKVPSLFITALHLCISTLPFLTNAVVFSPRPKSHRSVDVVFILVDRPFPVPE